MNKVIHLTLATVTLFVLLGALLWPWLGHSLAATNVEEVDSDPRISVGGSDCQQLYSASVFNISAMSYGAVSTAAIRALNGGSWPPWKWCPRAKRAAKGFGVNSRFMEN